MCIFAMIRNAVSSLSEGEREKGFTSTLFFILETRIQIQIMLRKVVLSNLARKALLHRTRTNAIASTSSTSASSQLFRSSSSFMNANNINNKQISTSSSNAEEQQQQQQENDKMGEDKTRYNKSSGPVAKLLHLIFKNQPIDSQKLYTLAVENAVEIHSRRHMKILLQSIKSRKQFTASENNNNTNKNKKKKKRFDGFIKAARPLDASGKTTKVTYTFSVEERGRKHLEKLGLIEARAEEEGNNNNSE